MKKYVVLVLLILSIPYTIQFNQLSGQGYSHAEVNESNEDKSNEDNRVIITDVSEVFSTSNLAASVLQSQKPKKDHGPQQATSTPPDTTTPPVQDPAPSPTPDPVPVTPSPTPATTTEPIQTPATATTATSTPASTSQISLAIKSVDVMKYSKDVICNPPSASEINTQVQKAIDLGANTVAVSGFYDDPACAPDLPLITAWATAIHSRGLKLWLRMKDLNFEGDYSVLKGGSHDSHVQVMLSWIGAHKSILKSGDMFTPFAEIQNGGIQGVSYCAQNACQFPNAADFNGFIRSVQSQAVNALPGIKVGYYGFDAFMAAGIGNPDWEGKSQLEPATIALIGEVTIDHYPEAIGHTFAQDLPIIHRTVGLNIPIIIGEYGTIASTGEQEQVTQINKEMPMILADPWVTGFNYWDLGPSGQEALVHSDYSNKPGFDALTTYYKK
jgi:hypothetical protein